MIRQDHLKNALQWRALLIICFISYSSILGIAQGSLDFHQSMCDPYTTEPFELKERIIQKELKDDTLTIVLGKRAVCCATFVADFELKEDTLRLNFQNIGDACFCFCFYKLTFKISNLRNDSLSLLFNGEEYPFTDQEYPVFTYTVDTLTNGNRVRSKYEDGILISQIEDQDTSKIYRFYKNGVFDWGERISKTHLINLDRLTISGKVTESSTGQSVSNCRLSLFSTSGKVYTATSGSDGHYTFLDIDNHDTQFQFRLFKEGYFETVIKMSFVGRSHDTILDLQIERMPIDVLWLPEIHFKENKAVPLKGYSDTLASLVQIMRLKPDRGLVIIGYKDEAENKDVRLARAEFVYEYMVGMGIQPDRLRVEISEEPNVLKPNEVYTYDVTGKFILVKLTEEYIQSQGPEKVRKSLRQKNRTVCFRVF